MSSACCVNFRSGVIALAALLLVLVTLVYALRAPVDFDEGFNLQIPASLAAGTGYATTGGSLTPFNPVISTGPPVLLPIAAVFKLLGPDLAPARMVMALYFLAALALLGLLSAKLYGWRSAAICVLLAVILPDIFRFGLKALGELPGVFWMLAGTLLLMRRRPVLAGLCFGAAALTKFLLIMALPPLVLLMLLECWVSWPRVRAPLRFYAVVFAGLLLPLIVWELAQYASLGLVGYIHTKLGFYFLLKSGGGAGAGANSSDLAARLTTLHQTFGVPGIAVVAVILAILARHLLRAPHLVRALKAGPSPRGDLFLLFFCSLNIAWWLFTPNQGWWRHLLPAAILLCPLAASGLFDAIDAALSWTGWRRWIPVAAAGAGVLVLAGLSARQTLSLFSQISSPELACQRRTALEAARFIDSGGQIGYWDWFQAPEISFLANRRFRDISLPENREKLDAGRSPIQKVRVLVTPVQMKSPRDSMASERKFCGRLLGDTCGYRIYEYIPDSDFRTQYRYLLQREDLGGFTPSLDFAADNVNPAQIEGGLYPADGWAGPHADFWIPRSRGAATLAISGQKPPGFHRPLKLTATAMGIPLGSRALTGGAFQARFALPGSLSQYRCIKICLRASPQITYRDYLKQRDRERGGAGLKARLRALVHTAWPDRRSLSYRISSIRVISDAASQSPSRAGSP